MLRRQLEDQLQAEEQSPSSDAIGVGVAGKSGAAVGIERRALESSCRDVVQNRVGNTKKLYVHNVERLCLELSRYPLVELDVLEDGEIVGADGLPAKRVAAYSCIGRAHDLGSGWIVMDPMCASNGGDAALALSATSSKTWVCKADQCAKRLGGFSAGGSGAGCQSSVAVLPHRSNWQASIAQDGAACIKLSAKNCGRIAKAPVRVTLYCCVRLSRRVAVGGVNLPAAQHVPRKAVLLFVKRQIVNEGDADYVRKIYSRVSPFRCARRKWILRIGQCVAPSQRTEYLAGIVDRFAIGVGSSGGYATPASNSQFAL